MPSEHRLPPVSILFALSGSLKAFVLPALVLLIVSTLRGSSFDRGQLWLGLFLVLGAVSAVLRYLTFRLTYEGTELVIRSGLLFRNERHVPYDRIQNLDATRSLLHRVFGVADVRVETGGGLEPEARISVLRESEFEEMRRRVFEGRARARSHPVAADTAAAMPEVAAPPTAQTLLHLPLRELLLLGLFDNRGFLLIAAAYGVLWESGLQGALWERLAANLPGPETVSSIRESLMAGQPPSFALVGIMAGGLFGLVLALRVLSMAWVTVTLHDFRLSRAGEDLRTEYGLFTRVTTTVPRRRIQSLTIRETPLHRWCGRASVVVQTAGGSTAAPQVARRPRERLAPIVRAAAVPDLIRHLLPEADLANVTWQPLHPCAARRAVKPLLAMVAASTVYLSIPLSLVAGGRYWPAALVYLAMGTAAAVAITRRRVRCTGWVSDEHVVALRSGWLWRSVTFAPVEKIQSVTTTESPFDRRAIMATVAIDTAGGVRALPRIRIPYLARETALDLAGSLSTKAAHTTFRW